MTNTVENITQNFLEVVQTFPEIRYIGDPILRTPAATVEFTEGLKIGKRLGEILIQYRKKAGYGRGLAAAQIGESKRVFVTYLNDQVQIYINPEITWHSGKTNFYRELCLSNGPIWGDIERSESVRMSWTDENREMQEKVVDGSLARIWQHEYDHLDEIICLDKAVPGTIEFATSSPLTEQFRDKSINIFPACSAT
jgi:peptide deformylase